MMWSFKNSTNFVRFTSHKQSICQLAWKTQHLESGPKSMCTVLYQIYHCISYLKLTNPCDAFRGQSRSPNIVPFHMLGIVSSCAIVTFFLIFDFKIVVILKSGSEVTQGHWKLYHSIDCIWFPISVIQKLCP